MSRAPRCPVCGSVLVSSVSGDWLFCLAGAGESPRPGARQSPERRCLFEAWQETGRPRRYRASEAALEAARLAALAAPRSQPASERAPDDEERRVALARVFEPGAFEASGARACREPEHRALWAETRAGDYVQACETCSPSLYRDALALASREGMTQESGEPVPAPSEETAA